VIKDFSFVVKLNSSPIPSSKMVYARLKIGCLESIKLINAESASPCNKRLLSSLKRPEKSYWAARRAQITVAIKSSSNRKCRPHLESCLSQN